MTLAISIIYLVVFAIPVIIAYKNNSHKLPTSILSFLGWILMPIPPITVFSKGYLTLCLILWVIALICSITKEDKK